MSHPPSDLPVAIGQIIAGRYAVSGILGRGGMGVVLAGRHLELGEQVAIKFLHRENAAHADRFFREARAAARIRSEHVVRIFDVGRLPSGEPYIVMEHLRGEDLSTRLERVGAMSPAQVADALLDVCQALAEAHAVGVVHRDLKPANIFLARSPSGDDLVKLLDFGVAKVPEAGAMTRTATLLGSPVYMSPEQLMASREVDVRSDIWSLGVILFELLTGELPFEGDSLVHLGITVREKPTPLARDRRPDLPEGLDAVIARCLAKDRAQRFPDVGEFVAALAPFLSPGLEHTVPRIKRVLEEGRRRNALASTLPPPSDEPALELSLESLAATSHVSGDESARGSREQARGSSPPALGSATLAALSTSADARTRQRSKLALGMLLGTAVIAALLLALGTRWRSRPEEGHKLVSVASPHVSFTADAEPTSNGALVVANPASAVTVPSSPTVLVPIASAAPSQPLRPAVRTPKKDPGRLATTVASTTAAPSPTPPPNCNPPYTLDEAGVRHPKSECL